MPSSPYVLRTGMAGIASPVPTRSAEVGAEATATVFASVAAAPGPATDLFGLRDGVPFAGGPQAASSAVPGPVAAALTPQQAGAGSMAAASQVATVMRSAREGELEITLSPQELGRVRMVMSPSETGLSVVLIAERPETLDLLRRHADLLQDALQQSGRGSVDISFGDRGKGGDAPPGGTGKPAHVALAEPGGAPSELPARGSPIARADRLDLRL